jgi:catechol 2,3-dioxygenase-like lactoylglutathione lyase family enzyme
VGQRGPVLHHVGIVVADLARAMEESTAALGYAWNPPVTLTMPLRGGDREFVATVSCAMSANGSPRLELIEAVPGTCWGPETVGQHHLALWVEDLAAASERLAAAGCPRELARRGGDERPEGFAYHGSEPLGLRVELLDGRLRPGAEAAGW